MCINLINKDEFYSCFKIMCMFTGLYVINSYC